MSPVTVISAYVYMFLFGSMFGWVLELFFRRFFSAVNKGKWMNPGFLNGPYVPLYGFGLCILFTICYFAKQMPLSTIPKYIIIIVMVGIGLTLIELIAGLIFIRHMHLKLWDYENEPFNYKGLICLKFSIFWTVLGAIYLFFIHGHILEMVTDLIDNIEYNFFVGMMFGIFLVDFVYTMHFVKSIKKFAQEHEVVIKYESLKFQLREEAIHLSKDANNQFDELRELATEEIDELKERAAKLFEPYRYKHRSHVHESKLGKWFRTYVLIYTDITAFKSNMKKLKDNIKEDSTK